MANFVEGSLSDPVPADLNGGLDPQSGRECFHTSMTRDEGKSTLPGYEGMSWRVKQYLQQPNAQDEVRWPGKADLARRFTTATI
ncbi:hypothetical protein N7539_008429 [Penicillium diatomitis]|uniref:Uncharacterized protein n=1 Tax=Penicillium diatomitis TaxID=2819901 RepID=A0A9X0BNG7_9EURO|nr:uncharacterized protein N7539_008429 [Penicillium diatomitis]KAJ5475363.1 hypothetical protein N7539_008429 [Penicillium diatomitis]